VGCISLLKCQAPVLGGGLTHKEKIMGDKKKIMDFIDAKAGLFTNISDCIWKFAEIRFDLKQSADTICNTLRSEDFKIERGIGGMAHAFVATYGSGTPVIGILGEYDALPNLNQVAGITEKKEEKPDGNGHGCGHHLLGTGALAGAIGIKDYIKETGLQGTIKYFGCPAEESGSGKAFIANAGFFNGIDAFLTWHPMNENMVWGSSTLANYQIYYSFEGRAAHAALAPEYGRSALDACELMNIGVNYLREHIIQGARIHYAYNNSGGKAPNIVPANAELLYYIRAPKTRQVRDIFERITDIAKGAALMTGTTMNMRWDSYCAEYLVNDALSKVMYENLLLVGPSQYTKGELDFAKSFIETLPESSKQGISATVKRLFFGESDKRIEEIASKPIISDIVPYTLNPYPLLISTDVGDASWHAPTAQFTTACFPAGTVVHSWQCVAFGLSSVAHKGMLQAGKVIATTALDILENPLLVEKIRAEYIKSLEGDSYQNPLPSDMLPEM